MKFQKRAPDSQPTTDSTSTVATDSTVAVDVPTVVQPVKLDPKTAIKLYKETKLDLEAAKARQVALENELSNRVNDIFTAAGKGPFKIDGATVVVTSRKRKNSESKHWFLSELGTEVQSFDD
jgi:hypothetical protein